MVIEILLFEKYLFLIFCFSGWKMMLFDTSSVFSLFQK